MKGARFVVLSLRDILKTLTLILIVIAVIVALIFLFLPSKEVEESVKYNSGTYTSFVDLKGEPLEIFVTIDESGILEINTSTLSDQQLTYYPLITDSFENLKTQVLKHQSVDIKLSSDNYYTEQILLNAINDALAKATPK